MTTTSDQMKIFDTLNSSSPSVTVIDVRAGLLSPALASLRDIGFLDAAKSGQITFAVFHILGPSIASLTRSRRPPISCWARNISWSRISSTTPAFSNGPGDLQFLFPPHQGRHRAHHPKLNEMAYEQVEVASVPFLKFVANKGIQDEARTIRSCCAAMSATGWPMSGANSTASS